MRERERKRDVKRGKYVDVVDQPQRGLVPSPLARILLELLEADVFIVSI
jgi:hypothetical protein